jgi:hypothetical protein
VTVGCRAGIELLNGLYILDLRNGVNTWRKVDLQPSAAQQSFTLLHPWDSKLEMVGQDLVIRASGGLRACAPAPRQQAAWTLHYYCVHTDSNVAQGVHEEVCEGRGAVPEV